MSTDVVNEALTTVRLQIINSRESFSADAYVNLCNSCQYLRYHLMECDVVAFNNYVDRLLAEHPDRADFLLEALFDELGIETRDQLSELLVQP